MFQRRRWSFRRKYSSYYYPYRIFIYRWCKASSTPQNLSTDSVISDTATPFSFSNIDPYYSSIRISTQAQFCTYSHNNLVLSVVTKIISIFNHKSLKNYYPKYNSKQKYYVPCFIKDNTYLKSLSHQNITT